MIGQGLSRFTETFGENNYLMDNLISGKKSFDSKKSKHSCIQVEKMALNKKNTYEKTGGPF